MGHVRTLATDTVNAAATSKAITVPFAVPAGHTLLIPCVWESAAGAVPTVTTVADSRGNTYTTTPDVSVNAGTTVSCATLRGRVTTPLQVGDTITVTIGSSRARWDLQIDQFDDVVASPFDVGAVNAPGSAAALSSGTTLDTSQPYELVYCVFGFGSGRTVTVPPGWTFGPKVETSAGSSDRGMQVIHRYVSTTGAQEGTIMLSTASTYVGAISTYRASAPPAPTGSAAGWGFIPI